MKPLIKMISRFGSETSKMLIRVTAVEECDATTDNTSNPDD
jgi:hypothetical protein